MDACRTSCHEEAAALTLVSCLPVPLDSQILLDFQLRGHERFLQRFRDLFRQFDQGGFLP